MFSLKSKLLSFGKKVSSVIDDIDEKLDNVENAINTNIKNTISYVASIPNALINHTTTTNLSILNNNYTITAPTNQDLNNTPTMSEFLNIAHNGYVFSGKPDGIDPFLVNGKQLSIQDTSTGMSAKVWVTPEKQVVIAYQGTTGGDSVVLNPLLVPEQVVSDVTICNQQVSDAQKAAVKFAQYAVHEAELQGYNTNNIFITGHSLGGSVASYVGQQTGLAGVAFESTGIPSSSTAKGTGDNFVNVVNYGDPWAEYASDTAGNSAIVQALPAGASGEFNHYGKVVTVGDKADSITVQDKLADWKSSSTVSVLASMLRVFPDFMEYHNVGTQAANMGIELSQHSYTLDTIYTQHGPVIPMANDSLMQAMDRSNTSLVAQA